MSTCLFNRICSFQTAFQGGVMILISAISIQGSLIPYTPRTTRPVFGVWQPEGGALCQWCFNRHFPDGSWLWTSPPVSQQIVNELLFCELLIYILCPSFYWFLKIFFLSISNSLRSIIGIHHLSVVCFTNMYSSKFIIFILFVYGFFFHTKINIPTKSNIPTFLV